MARRPQRTPRELPPVSERVLELIRQGRFDDADKQAIAELAERVQRELREARDSLLPRVAPNAWLSSNRKLLDLAVRRRIALERYSNLQHQKMIAFLDLVEDDIAAKITALRESLGAAASQSRKYDDLIKLKASVRAVIEESMTYTSGVIKSSLEGLAGTYNADVRGLLEALAQSNGGVGLTARTQFVTVEAAMAAAMARPMDGYLLQDWLDGFSTAARDRIEATLRVAFIEGEALSVTRQRLRNVTMQTSRGLDALIRTANAHIANAVTEANYQANPDLIEGVEWVSTLDSRTTDICRARDGKRYKVGEGPRPPAHINCRSTTIPALIGVEPVARETYAEWLKRQPADVQDDILGPARGKLFRDGKLTVDRFVDSTGKRIPLNRLRA